MKINMSDDQEDTLMFCNLKPFPTCALSEFRTLVHLRIVGKFGCLKGTYYPKEPFFERRCYLHSTLYDVLPVGLAQKISSLYKLRSKKCSFYIIFHFPKCKS